MRWYERGEGMSVVFLHGIPTSPLLWRHVIPLVTDARSLAWEMVGYGDSIPQGVGRDLSISRQADYLIEWLRAIGLSRAVFVGHDLGGGVAQIAALRHPEVCAGLVLTESVGYDSWPVAPVRAMQAAGPVVARTPARLFRAGFRALIRTGHDRRDVADESFAVHWPPYGRHGGAAAMVRQVRDLDVRDTLAVAPGLPRLAPLPVRLVFGAADWAQPLRYAERFASDLEAPLHRIEGGRHFVPEDHPEPVARAVNEVVREAATRRAVPGPPPLRPVP
jgi:pimeloyl-ACP methyl ester carboxylesterase